MFYFPTPTSRPVADSLRRRRWQPSGLKNDGCNRLGSCFSLKRLSKCNRNITRNIHTCSLIFLWLTSREKKNRNIVGKCGSLVWEMYPYMGFACCCFLQEGVQKHEISAPFRAFRGTTKTISSGVICFSSISVLAGGEDWPPQIQQPMTRWLRRENRKHQWTNGTMLETRKPRPFYLAL